jgi:hypothetical protein
MLRVVVAVLMATILSPVALAQKSTGHMELDDMSAGGPRMAIARVAISKTDATCPHQTGMIRIGTFWGVKDTVIALPGPGDWAIESDAPDPDDFSFRRRLATASCRIDIDVSKQQQRNGDWIPLSKQSPEPPNVDSKVKDRGAMPSAENVFDRYERARRTAGGLRQGVIGIFANNLWKGDVQDCFEAVGVYLIDQSGVTLLFPTALGEELNRFFLERVDVDADHSTLYLSRDSCRVGFTISASVLREGAWVPLPITPFK